VHKREPWRRDLLCRAAVTAQARARQGDRVEGFERCHPNVAADGPPPPPDHRWSRSDRGLFISPYDHREPICDALQLRPKRRWLDCRACSCSSAGKRSRAHIASANPPAHIARYWRNPIPRARIDARGGRPLGAGEGTAPPIYKEIEMILDINFRLPSYVLKRNLPNYYMIEGQDTACPHCIYPLRKLDEGLYGL